MSPVDRRAAARAFRERVVTRGVFALRSAASPRVWVGASRNLDAEEGRLRFLLRQGMHRDAALRQAYARDGAAAFSFEILERLDDDLAALIVPDTLKARTAHWAAELGAQVLLP